jgi:hypothetical protein
MKTSKNSIIRRLQRYQGKLKKILVSKDLTNKSAILVNSFPKSGTHLLKQVFEPLGFDDYLQHPSSLPSFPHKVNDVDNDLKNMERIVQNELMCAHFFSRDELITYLLNHNVIHFFIYRDPRDVVLSEVNYLTNMNKLHGLHKFFKELKNEDERIKFGILGNEYINTGLPFPNIKERFDWYSKWLSVNNCYCVRFEDLVSPLSQKKVIKGIIQHLHMKKANHTLSVEEMIKLSTLGINPKGSHTFREGGGKGKWQSNFNETHKSLFKEVTKNLLIDLGYEKDINW